MRGMVVYDSLNGNTKQVAEAVADVLRSAGDVEVRHVGEAKAHELSSLDVLVVGAPTHAFRPSSDTKSFLRSIPEDALKGVRVVAFDTRISREDTDSGFLSFMIGLFGYAAKPMADRLKRKGGTLALPPEGFYVEDTEGPLKEGELERARDWVRPLASAD